MGNLLTLSGVLYYNEPLTFVAHKAYETDWQIKHSYIWTLLILPGFTEWLTILKYLSITNVTIDL